MITHLDADECFRAVASRDRRFDGVFFTAVRTTGIYCRPSCPAVTPKKRNVGFYPSAAAAQAAGFRACRRCLPDATPGSPQWDLRADVADRAMRLIADGVVERDGVEGLAVRLGYSSRQLHRLLTEQWAAGALALARSRRAQSARVLIESTTMTLTEVAFAAGFSSVRQFNDTIREVYAATPTQLRHGRRGSGAAAGVIGTRIAVREPFGRAALHDFLSRRCVDGIEEVEGDTYSRTLRLPRGAGRVSVDLGGDAKGAVAAQFWLHDVRDLAPALERTRRLLDADSDPAAVDAALGQDPALAASVRRLPGLRVPGHPDGFELAVRAVLGQQISVARAGALVAQVVQRWGTDSAVGRLFPSAAELAEADLSVLPIPRARARTLSALAAAVGAGLALDGSAARADVRQGLLDIPGIGPWTADYIAMRALGDPDVWLPTDAGTGHAAAVLGPDVNDLDRRSDDWRPWRSYAQMHLWAIAAGPGIGCVQERAVQDVDRD